MDHFQRIYSQHAHKYHQMIKAEDVDNNILPTVESITELSGKRILDLGTGTGRLPILFVNYADEVVGIDLHFDMLRENNEQKELAIGRWGLVQGDMRRIPMASNWADLITAGWALGHFSSWYKKTAYPQMRRVLQEMHRLVKPGGTLIIFETMTTGSVSPAPPTQNLAKYYQWLEDEWGFQGQVIQTDYQFASVDEAVEYTEFFFGPNLANIIRENKWARLPEWTGVWSKQCV